MSGGLPGNRLLGWISASGADAIGRIVLQVLATMLLARLLSPEIFGEASLTVVLVGVLTIFASAPFEEALTQRKVVQREHFSSCLAVVLLVSLFGVLVSVGVWLMVDFSGDAARIAPLAAVFSLTIFAEATISIYTAIARRHKAFERVAWSNLVGQVVGTAAGLALALGGAGVWSLLGLRMVARFVTMILLLGASPVRILPGFSVSHLRELSGFAGWSFGKRVLDTLTDAMFQGLVARFFGLDGAGYLNMALRIIEPVRGPTGSIGHNISMSFFVRLQNAPYKLRDMVEQTLTGTALILLPIFIGLAAVGPTIIEVIAGPGWGASGQLVIFLALGAALVCCTNFQQTGLTAKGRADLGCASSALELTVLVAGLWFLSGWGLIAAGIARLIAYGSNAGFMVLAARSVLQLGARSSLRMIAPLFLSTALMGLAVYTLGELQPFSGMALPLLLLQIATGVVMYGLLVTLFHRQRFLDAWSRLRKDARTPAAGRLAASSIQQG